MMENFHEGKCFSNQAHFSVKNIKMSQNFLRIFMTKYFKIVNSNFGKFEILFLKAKKVIALTYFFAFRDI